MLLHLNSVLSVVGRLKPYTLFESREQVMAFFHVLLISTNVHVLPACRLINFGVAQFLYMLDSKIRNHKNREVCSGTDVG